MQSISNRSGYGCLAFARQSSLDDFLPLVRRRLPPTIDPLLLLLNCVHDFLLMHGSHYLFQSRRIMTCNQSHLLSIIRSANGMAALQVHHDQHHHKTSLVQRARTLVSSYFLVLLFCRVKRFSAEWHSLVKAAIEYYIARITTLCQNDINAIHCEPHSFRLIVRCVICITRRILVYQC